MTREELYQKISLFVYLNKDYRHLTMEQAIEKFKSELTFESVSDAVSKLEAEKLEGETDE